jgi:hypothetical protein
VVDDGLRDAAHNEPLHRTQTPAADHDQVRVHLFRQVQDLVGGRSFPEVSLDAHSVALYRLYLLGEHLSCLLLELGAYVGLETSGRHGVPGVYDV